MIPATLPLRDFCAHIGVKASYGYDLRRAGRLVLADDGKAVQVAESIARIAATRDPAHQAVAERHAAERGAAALTGHAPTPAPAPAAGEGEGAGADGEEESAEPRSYNYQASKAKREHFAAERERLEYRKASGDLMERQAVTGAFADAGVTLRGKLEAWSAVLPPQLAGRDEAAIRATLADQVEMVLRDLVDRFNRFASEGGT